MLSVRLLAIAALASVGMGPLARADDQMSGIRSIAIVSILGNTIDFQTEGMTKFDYADYKVNTDWNLDDLIRNYLTKALSTRYRVKPLSSDSQPFHGVTSTFSETYWQVLGDRIRTMPRNSDLDAVVVVYPNVTDATGYIANDLAVTHDLPFLFRDGMTTVAASYAVAVFDAKTGQRLNYGTGRYPDSNYITGYSPPWEHCSNSLWAKSEDTLTAEQKERIRQELWSLITRSLPYALTSAGLISESEGNELVASAAPAADATCHSIG